MPVLRSNKAIAIAGAGPGGLCLALVLRHLGFPDVVVFERKPDLGDSSHMLELTANASRILLALGLQDELTGNAVQPDFSYVRTVRTGFVLSQRALGGFSSARYGAPAYLIRHNVLLDVLAAECQRRGVQLVTGQPVAEVTPETGTAHFTQGQPTRFEVVVAADGASSELRAIVAGDVSAGAASSTAGQCEPEAASELTNSATHADDKRVRVISASAPVAASSNAVQTFTGNHGYTTLYPAGDQRTDLLTVCEAAASPSADPLACVRELHGSSCAALARTLSQLDHAMEQPNVDAEPAAHWHAGKLALLGDACHPLPAFSTQGACAAIEDAWVLGTMMERWEESPAQGFTDYQRFRLPRVKKLRARAKEAAAELMMADRRQTLRRNLKWSLTGRFLPEIAMARFDWLYGYDCIRGFA